MKELNNNEMIKYTAGAKCIYHGIGIAAFAGLGIFGAYWSYKNGNSFRECLQNNH